MKRLSQLEWLELVTIDRREPNRFVSPRFDHLERRGLIHFVDAEPRLTAEGREAIAEFAAPRARRASRRGLR